MSISSDQCKNKLKWLKRKWAEYNADIRATSNSEVEVLEPPGLVQIQEFWSGSAGKNGQTLADSEANGPSIPSDEEADSDDEEQQPTDKNSGKNKRRKPMGDSFEIGMQSIADGFQSMAAAMAPPAASASGTTDRSMAALVGSRFNAMTQRQDEQLAQMQAQNQQHAVLIATLQRGNGN